MWHDLQKKIHTDKCHVRPQSQIDCQCWQQTVKCRIRYNSQVVCSLLQISSSLSWPVPPSATMGPTLIAIIIVAWRGFVQFVWKGSAALTAVACKWLSFVWWEPCYVTFQNIFTSELRATGGTFANWYSTVQETFGWRPFSCVTCAAEKAPF